MVTVASSPILELHPSRPIPLRTVPDSPLVRVESLGVSFGDKMVLKNVGMHLAPRGVHAIIGPSGCGKSTFLRALNRMHDLTPSACVEGRIFLDGEDILHESLDPVSLRRRVGMVFQRPNPFPTMSIMDNVLSGLRLTGRLPPKKDRLDIVENALQRAGLWAEVSDRLKAPATVLSGGQQQRLCVARALAVDPELLLMDEPCSALDPIATQRIEELIQQLGGETCVVVVTHNMQQARRISNRVAFFLQGELVEEGPAHQIFEAPMDSRTGDYVAGRFG
jgi:phosphate transport system ATP-binding protein